jgi:hypothetical protein
MQTHFKSLLEASTAARVNRTSEIYYAVKPDLDGWKIIPLSRDLENAEFYSAVKLLAIAVLTAETKGLDVHIAEENQYMIRIKYNFYSEDREVTFKAESANLGKMGKLTRMINNEIELGAIA